jgi:hypothetical protein
MAASLLHDIMISFTRGLVKNRGKQVVVQFEFLMTFSLADGVILRVAVLQAERTISATTLVYHGRSLGPLVKTRALRDDAL